jgi:peptidoglycan/LPS O-acetylase OafA/YrhL
MADRGVIDRSGHIVELQSLRGIAATAVLIGHALIYFETPEWFVTLAHTFNGRTAVVVFFVLSGYVLTRSLQRSQFGRDDVVTFYVQRFFRIYPAIWTSSALGLAYIFWLHWQIPVEHTSELVRSQFRADRLDLLHIVASLAGMTTFILPQLWTIFVEIVASIALPGIAFIALHRRSWFPKMLGAAVLISIIIPNTYYHVTMYFMDFVVGAGLAISGVATALFEKAPARILVLVGIVLLALTQDLPTDYWNPFVHIGETVIAASVIGMLIASRQRVLVLRSRVLLFLGDISYSVYLLHYAVICIMAKLLAVMHIGLGTIPLSLLLVSMALAVTLPLSWLSYVYVEKPGIRLGKQGLRHTQALLLAAARRS